MLGSWLRKILTEGINFGIWLRMQPFIFHGRRSAWRWLMVRWTNTAYILLGAFQFPTVSQHKLSLSLTESFFLSSRPFYDHCSGKYVQVLLCNTHCIISSQQQLIFFTNLGENLSLIWQCGRRVGIIFQDISYRSFSFRTFDADTTSPLLVPHSRYRAIILLFYLSIPPPQSLPFESCR